MARLVWKGKRGRPVAARPRGLKIAEIHGPPGPGWRDRLVLGHSEHVLGALAPELAGSVDLVYVDPPFDTGGSFDFLATLPGAPEGAPRLSVPAYEDARGLDRWLAWFAATATLLRELLAEGGSLYVHLDAHVVHYAKVVLDEIFGREAFQREIIWRIGWVSGFKSQARGWIRNHDTILFYAKGGRPKTFHKEHVPYPPGYVRRDGKPPTGKGYPIEDVWNASEGDRLDSIQIVSFSGEKVGYPTQKNEALVARIVRASSSPGDLVLDACVGSGTTAVVASRLGRRWIACDASPVAIHATRARLVRLPEPRPFVVMRQGLDREHGNDRLTVRVQAEGLTSRVELTGLEPPQGHESTKAHWAQWIDGWAVDWDGQSAELRAQSSVWRSKRGELALEASHAYEGPGRRVVRVRAYDVLGGVADASTRVDVSAQRDLFERPR